MFYIRKIILHTADDTPSVVEFGPGLNIIYGESNTGKSLILDCMDYMFGASDHRFDPLLKITSITLTLDVDGKSVTMSRQLDSNEIEVASSVRDIESDTYKIGRAKKNINSVWLKLIGIDDDVKILRSTEGAPQSLTLRTFSHTFVVDEERVHSFNSVLADAGNYGKVSTPIMAALMYLATANNFLPEDEQVSSKIRNQRKDAVKKYVDRSMAEISEKKLSEFEELSSESPAEIQKKIDLALSAIGAEEQALGDATYESRKLADRIIEIEKQLTESRVLKNRNKALMTQYESDIRRLSFIAEGDMHGQKIAKLDRCPFCNGELPKGKSESCIDAAIAEVDKLELKIKDLRSVQESIDEEQKELLAERDRVAIERSKVDALIRREIKPQIEALRDDMAKYTMALNQYKAREMIKEFSDVLVSQLAKTVEEESGGFKIDVRAKFEEIFGADLTNRLTDMLTLCNYQRFVNARFDCDDCDAVVNGVRKKSQGQGFRAFLNTILAIAMQDCIDEHELYSIGLMAIDSPIQSLKEKEDKIPVDERTTATMKSCLFQYLIDHQNRQTIIIENEIPKLDYTGVHIEEFTKDENRGRYGLITGYRK